MLDTEKNRGATKEAGGGRLGKVSPSSSESASTITGHFARACFLIFFIWIVASPAHAASFDCAKAATKVEKLVCADSEISGLDDELGKAYQQAMKQCRGEHLLKQGIVVNQKAWLKEMRNVCNDAACLKKAYSAQLGMMADFSEMLALYSDPKAVAALMKEPAKTAPARRMTKRPPASLEEIQQLLDVQINQLKEWQKNARNVLFFESDYLDQPKKIGNGLCGQFWDALKAQGSFDIPKPIVLAVSAEEKEKLLASLHAFAKNNFERYVSQDGKLNPDTYTDRYGTGPLGPFIKGNFNNPKDLPKKFAAAWQNKMANGFFDKYDLLDQNLAAHILYMQPYPVAGYVRPLVISLIKDQCDQCTGLSMGKRIVAVDGLPQPELGPAALVSQASYAETEAKAEKLGTGPPIGPFLLMGMGMFNGRPMFWILSQDTLTADTPMGEKIGHYSGGDGKLYFRKYQLNIGPMDSLGYDAPGAGACFVRFN